MNQDLLAIYTGIPELNVLNNRTIQQSRSNYHVTLEQLGPWPDFPNEVKRETRQRLPDIRTVTVPPLAVWIASKFFLRKDSWEDLTRRSASSSAGPLEPSPFQGFSQKSRSEAKGLDVRARRYQTSAYRTIRSRFACWAREKHTGRPSSLECFWTAVATGPISGLSSVRSDHTFNDEVLIVL